MPSVTVEASRVRICAIIPARNEMFTIRAAIGNARAAKATAVHVIVNGSTDGTAETALEVWPPVNVLAFDEPLGVDVPRAVGASLCLAGNLPAAVLFLDGDMGGPFGRALHGLIDPVVRGNLDLSLTDCTEATCRAPEAAKHGMFAEVMEARLDLNRRLGLAGAIGAATPSHGPFACSRSLISQAGPTPFAVPPILLSVAVLSGLRVGIGMQVRHDLLGSPDRGPEHARLITDTIIGDCAEAIAFHAGLPRSRRYAGRLREGLNPTRRFDILENVLSSLLAS